MYLREHDGPEMKLPRVPITSKDSIDGTGPPNRRGAMPERIEKPNWTPSDGATSRKGAEPQPPRENEQVQITFGNPGSTNHLVLRNPGRKA